MTTMTRGGRTSHNRVKQHHRRQRTSRTGGWTGGVLVAQSSRRGRRMPGLSARGMGLQQLSVRKRRRGAGLVHSIAEASLESGRGRDHGIRVGLGTPQSTSDKQWELSGPFAELT